MSPSPKLRIAFIACGGGGVIDALCSIQHHHAWPYDIAGVITDRSCGAQTVARKHNLMLANIHEPREDLFSRYAANTITEWNANCVVLLFLRRVAPAVWNHSHAMVWNLHPSILPLYPGIGALARNFEDARVAAQHGALIPMGVTLHKATGDLDEGPIIDHKQFTIEDAPTFDRANHLCFLCKVGLVLEAVCNSTRMNRLPRNNSSINKAIVEAQQRVAQPWAVPWLQRSMTHVEVEADVRALNR